MLYVYLNHFSITLLAFVFFVFCEEGHQREVVVLLLFLGGPMPELSCLPVSGHMYDVCVCAFVPCCTFHLLEGRQKREAAVFLFRVLFFVGGWWPRAGTACLSFPQLACGRVSVLPSGMIMPEFSGRVTLFFARRS